MAPNYLTLARRIDEVFALYGLTGLTTEPRLAVPFSPFAYFGLS